MTIDAATLDTPSKMHQDDSSDMVTTQPASSMRPLISIFNFGVEKLRELSKDDSIDDKQGFKTVFKIVTLIGNTIIGGPIDSDDSVRTLSEFLDIGVQPTNGHENGHENGHTNGSTKNGASKPTRTKTPVKKAKTRERSEPESKEIRPKKPLVGKESLLYKFLMSNRGVHQPTKLIAKACGLANESHVSPYISKLRVKGIPIVNAEAQRRSGENINEQFQGYMIP